ncbi:MAG: hypothetical protein ABR886_12890 [Dehalococcoidales bacterium]|jgi:hypothetical protein
MNYWLHQSSESVWSISDYRVEMWENNNENWRLGTITPQGSIPEQGDIVIFYYAKGHSFDCGIVGWGIVLRYDPIDYKERTIKEMRFRLSSPSDYLKMNPLWNDNIKNIINQIRGKQYRGNFWAINEDQMLVIRQEIEQHI